MNQLTKNKPLRPFQSEGLARVDDLYAEQVGKICFVAPTGAGKTRCLAEFVVAEAAKGRRIIVLAHRTELIEQISQTLDEAGVDHGVIKAKHARRKPKLPVQVASVQTLHRRLKAAPGADILIFDECHRTMADSYLAIIEAYPQARLLGLTATPWRMDNKGLGNVYEAMVVAATAPQLIAWGYLVSPTVYAPTLTDLSSVKINSFGDFDDGDMARVMNTQALCGNVVQHWQRISSGKRTLVFACNVTHSKALCARFVEAGVAAEHVDGTTPAEDRRAIFERLRSGETLVVCNVNIATEGLDIPSLGTVVLAVGTKSISKYLQAAGRGMRPYPGKERAYLIDHADNVHRHGLPSDDRDFRLSDRMPEEEPQVKDCPKCFAVLKKTARVCKECGYAFPAKPEAESLPTPSENKADLVRVSPANGDKDAANTNTPKEKPRKKLPEPIVARPRKLTSHCPDCGGPTEEARDVARWGHFGVIVQCQWRCRRPWFLTDQEGARTATDQQKREEWRRIVRLSEQKPDRGPRWAKALYLYLFRHTAA